MPAHSGRVKVSCQSGSRAACDEPAPRARSALVLDSPKRPYASADTRDPNTFCTVLACHLAPHARVGTPASFRASAMRRSTRPSSVWSRSYARPSRRSWAGAGGSVSVALACRPNEPAPRARCPIHGRSSSRASEGAEVSAAGLGSELDVDDDVRRSGERSVERRCAGAVEGPP